LPKKTNLKTGEEANSMSRKKKTTKPEETTEETPVVDEEEDIGNEHPVYSRQRDIDKIVARRNDDFEKDTGIKLSEYEDTPETAEEVEDGADETDTETADEKETDEHEEEAQSGGQDGKKIKIVIDGEETEVDYDSVLEAGKQTLQKERAADRRLQEAELKRQEAERFLQSAKQQKPEIDKVAEKEKLEAQQKDSLAELKKSIEKARADHIKAINYGEEDEVLKAAQDYEAAIEAYNDAKYGASKNIDYDTVVNEVVTRSKYADIQSRLSKAPDEGGYADIYENPYLRGWASEEVNRLISDGAPDEWATYQKACEKVREQLGWAKQDGDNGKKPKETPTLGQKVTRKERIDNLDTASGRQETVTEREESPSEVIAKMRKARVGQEI
jgi:hypothetical protein